MVNLYLPQCRQESRAKKCFDCYLVRHSVETIRKGKILTFTPSTPILSIIGSQFLMAQRFSVDLSCLVQYCE